MSSLCDSTRGWLSLHKCSLRRVFVVLLAVCVLSVLALSYVYEGYGSFSPLLTFHGQDDPLRRIDQYLHHLKTVNTPQQDKWIIVDVSPPHCQGHGRVQVPRGWKVILARETTPPMNDNWSWLDTLSLDTDGNQSVGEGGEAPVLKNAAYLSAILRGGRLLLDTDCSLSAAQALNVLNVTEASEHGLVYNNTRLFNPYAHFGAWASVPRAAGWPGPLKNSRTYYIRDLHRVPVKHALSDKSRDAVVVEGNNERTANGVGVTFDPSAPPVYLGRGSFAPAVAASSLYQQQALWGLLLPCVSPTPACHVLRQLVLQRLLWELDAFSAYYQLSSSVVGSRSGSNPASRSAPASRPLPASQSPLASQSPPQSASASRLSPQSPSASQSPPQSPSASQSPHSFQPAPALDVPALAEVLDAWTCKASLTFYGCFQSLADHLHEKSYIPQQDHRLVRLWIQALRSSRLPEPTRVARPWRGDRRLGEVKVTLGSLWQRVQSGGTRGVHDLWRQSIHPMIKQCGVNATSWLPSPDHWISPLMDDIVLIVVFNKLQYVWPNMALLETIHRPFFKHIVYCLTDVDPKSSGPRYQNWYHVVLLEGLSDGWFLMYGCVTSVMQMKLAGARGYLMIGDDTLLNTWNFLNVSRDVILQRRGGRIFHADGPISVRWVWWRKPIGRCATLKSLAGLEKISRMTSQQLKDLTPSLNRTAPFLTFSQIVERDRASLTCPLLPGSEVWPDPSPETARRFLHNYYHVHNMSGLVHTTAHDFIYIPQAVAEDYISISRYFMKHRAMIEVAFSAIEYGLATRGSLVPVEGTSLWGKSRNKPGAVFKESDFFLHPFKLKRPKVRRAGDNFDFYCGVFLRKLFSFLAGKV